MNDISLYVAKADGTREVLDRVQLKMACEIFARVNWDEEVRMFEDRQERNNASHSEAEKEGPLSLMEWDSYVPEFGLSDEEERILVVSPVSAGTVSFWVQCPAYGWAVAEYPKGEVTALLERYFAGDDDGIQAIAARYAPALEVELHELSAAEFEATKAGQMRWVGAVETYNQVGLRDYLSACIDQLSLPTSLDTIELTNIYRAADDRHSHLHFDFGQPATALVLVAGHQPGHADTAVIGHHFIDLAAGGPST